jgi:hypothetical protein
MDPGEIAIEGAGIALVATLMIGAYATVANRRRLIFGICLGLLLAAFALPFVAYVVARITNHQASHVDLTAPAYVVVTALVCSGFAVLGMIGGALAEWRRRSASHRTPERARDLPDDPAQWLPWAERDAEPGNR